MIVRLSSAIMILAVVSLCVAQPPVHFDDPPLPAGAIARLGDLRYAHPDQVNSLALSPDGKTIATAGFEQLYVWDADTGRVSQTISVSKWRWIYSLAFSSDGSLLAAGTNEDKFGIWEVRTGKPLWTPASRSAGPERLSGRRHLPRGITGLRFLPGDKLLAVESDRPSVRVWDVRKGTEVESHSAPEMPVGFEMTSVGLSPSGEMTAWLASPSLRADEKKGPAIFLFETIGGKRLPASDHLEPEKDYFGVHSSDFRLLDEGKTLLAGGRVFDLATGKRRFEIDYRLAYYQSRPNGERFDNFLAISPDRKTLFTRDELGMRRWDVATGKMVSDDGAFRHLAFSADGKRAVGSLGQRLVVCDDKLAPIHTDAGWDRAPSVEFASSSKLTTTTNTNSQVWDLKSRKIIESAVLKHGGTPSVGRTPCNHGGRGKLFVYHGDGNWVVVHDIEDNRQLCRLEGTHYEDDRSCWSIFPSLSEDGTRALVASPEEKHILVRWFDARNGKEVGRCRIALTAMYPEDRPVWPVQYFAEDGSEFGYLTPDSRLAIVDCKTGKVNRTIGIAWPLAQPSENGLRFPAWRYGRPDSRSLLATRTIDYNAKSTELALFDRPNGRRLGRFVLQSMEGEPILSADRRFLAVSQVYSQDPERQCELPIFEIATGSRRGTIRVPHPVVDFAFAPDGRTMAISCRNTSVYLWDLDRLDGRKFAALDHADDDQLWRTLGDKDATVAHPAMVALEQAPASALALFERRLKPATAPTADHLAKLIASLDDADFRQRDEAARTLAELGELALPAIQRAAEMGSLDQRRVLSQLIAKLEAPNAVPRFLAEMRSVEILERMNDPRARRLLEAVAAGAEEAMLTQDAQMAVRRLGASR